jgi:hypothetical protein
MLSSLLKEVLSTAREDARLQILCDQDSYEGETPSADFQGRRLFTDARRHVTELAGSVSRRRAICGIVTSLGATFAGSSKLFSSSALTLVSTVAAAVGARLPAPLSAMTPPTGCRRRSRL